VHKGLKRVEPEGLILADRSTAPQGAGSFDLFGVGVSHIVARNGFPVNMQLVAFARVRFDAGDEGTEHRAEVRARLNERAVRQQPAEGMFRQQHGLTHATLLFNVGVEVPTIGDLAFILVLDGVERAQAVVRVLAAATA
jgi:hypothetical protein